MKILIANVGSTSFKYKLFEIDSEEVLGEGKIERVGSESSPVFHKSTGKRPVSEEIGIPDYPSAIRKAIDLITDLDTGCIDELSEISAVGFKTVHLRGKPGVYILDEEILGRMEEYNDLVPVHNPPYIRAIMIFREMLPDLPLVGLFEPAFHTTLPDYAYIYGVPYEWYEKYGVRKYGFHGASHRYISERVPELLGSEAYGLKIVSCHLGGSSSICAIRDGKSVDTSMGFSAQDGLLNATRNGHIDPFLIPFIMDREKLNTDQIREILSRKSGLLGISGVSGDMRDIQDAAEEGNSRARLSIEKFCYDVKKYIGAYAFAMGGIDVIAFTGGIGEKAPDIRSKICSGLEFTDISIDETKNWSPESEKIISPEDSRVKVLVVPANEELIVARETAKLVRNRTLSDS